MLTPRQASKPLPWASRALQITAVRLEYPDNPPAKQDPRDPIPTADPKVPLAGVPRPLKQQLSLADRLALQFRDYIPNATETYVAFDITRDLYTECANQAAYVDGLDMSESALFWYSTCKRETTFASWAQVTILHMWMLNTRIRALEKEKVAIWQQHFIDHFFYDSEDKMAKRYGIKTSTKRGQYMKDLYHQYRGMTAAFDEGLVRGDAVMATALWRCVGLYTMRLFTDGFRNLFNADDNVDLELLALITSHVRRVVSRLDKVNDEVILKGQVTFGMPLEEMSLVQKKSDYLEQEADKM